MVIRVGLGNKATPRLFKVLGNDNGNDMISVARTMKHFFTTFLFARSRCLSFFPICAYDIMAIHIHLEHTRQQHASKLQQYFCLITLVLKFIMCVRLYTPFSRDSSPGSSYK
jgi:hypothetical protein